MFLKIFGNRIKYCFCNEFRHKIHNFFQVARMWSLRKNRNQLKTQLAKAWVADPQFANHSKRLQQHATNYRNPRFPESVHIPKIISPLNQYNECPKEKPPNWAIELSHFLDSVVSVRMRLIIVFVYTFTDATIRTIFNVTIRSSDSVKRGVFPRSREPWLIWYLFFFAEISFTCSLQPWLW